MAKTKQGATYDQILALPDNVVGEILEGELIASPRPASPHAVATSALGADLGGAFHRPPGGPAGPGGWWILYEPELHLHGDVVVPDMAGWRRERMPHVPNVAAFELPPDWACEVISPLSARYDRGAKMRIYGREGVRHVWLVDPLARMLEVFRAENSRWVFLATFCEAERIRAEPFEAIELELERWWIETE